MTTLPALLGILSRVIEAHPICEKVIGIESQAFSSDQFLLRLRVDLGGDRRLQVRIYPNRGHIDYSYQVYTDVPILRWDNKEEFRTLATYPHHHHDQEGHILPSPLVGDPARDLAFVLNEIAAMKADATSSDPPSSSLVSRLSP